MISRVNDKSNIIFFDGVCNLCNFWVRYIIRNDPDGDFYFSSLQSDSAVTFLKKNNIEPDFKTIILYNEGQFLTASDAIISILYKNGGINRFISKLIKPIPVKTRNSLYGYISRKRYFFFGKREVCMIPDNHIKKRFL